MFFHKKKSTALVNTSHCQLPGKKKKKLDSTYKREASLGPSKYVTYMHIIE